MIGAHASNAVVVIADCDDCGVDSRPADFGTVGTSSTRWFTVRNNGALTAAMVRDAGLLGGGFAFAGGNYPGTNGSCSNTLAPGMSCQVTVTFTPPGPGSFAGTLGVAYDDGTGTTAIATRALTGTQTSLALLKVHDWSENDNGGGDFYDLGTIGVPVDHTFTITQRRRAARDADGGRRRPRQRVQLEGRQLPGTNGTCRRRSRPARTARWSSASRPRAAASAPASSSLLLRRREHASTRSGRCPRPRPTGRCLQITDWSKPPRRRTAPASRPTTTARRARPSAHTFTVTNWGGVPATLIADGGTRWAAASAGPATRRSAAAPAARCWRRARAAPSASRSRRSGDGARTSTLSLSYNDGGTTQVAARAVTGTATTKALLNVYDYNGPNGPDGRERQRTAVRLRRVGRRRRPRVHRAQRRRRPGDDGGERRYAGNGVRLEGRHATRAPAATAAPCWRSARPASWWSRSRPAARRRCSVRCGSRTTTAAPRAPRSAR